MQKAAQLAAAPCASRGDQQRILDQERKIHWMTSRLRRHGDDQQVLPARRVVGHLELCAREGARVRRFEAAAAAAGDGGKKLRSLGGDVGGAISEFKSSLNSDDEEEEKPAEPANAAPATSAENSEVSTEQ